MLKAHTTVSIPSVKVGGGGCFLCSFAFISWLLELEGKGEVGVVSGGRVRGEGLSIDFRHVSHRLLKIQVLTDSAGGGWRGAGL